jgi:UDP-N-acetylmuramoylalanine-D-glutamate ligase
VDALEAALAAAEARAGEESAKAAQAIAAFQSLAERLEAVAEAPGP